MTRPNAGAHAASGDFSDQASGHFSDQASGDSSNQASGTSVGELVGEVSRDLSTLIRQELELAKAELKQEAAKAGKGAGMLGGAGFAGYMVLLFVSFAAWWGLANVMDQAWAALIVAAIWAVIGAALLLAGRRQLREFHPAPQQTTETIKEIPGALTGR